jgi:hypothetical protein
MHTIMWAGMLVLLLSPWMLAAGKWARVPGTDACSNGLKSTSCINAAVGLRRLRDDAAHTSWQPRPAGFDAC